MAIRRRRLNVMCFIWLGVLGCRTDCSFFSRTTPLKGSWICSPWKVLGEIPSIGGSCSTDRSCLRQSKGRLNWARCVAGRCLFGVGKAEKSHLAPIKSMVYLTKQRIVTGDEKGEIRGWDVKTSRSLFVVHEHKGAVSALANHASGQFVSGGADGRVILWNRNGNKISSWKLKAKVTDLAFDIRSNLLVASTTDARLWYKYEDTWRSVRGHRDVIRSVSFHPKKRLLVTASDDRTLRLWMWLLPSKKPFSLELKPLNTLSSHLGWARRASFFPTAPWDIVSCGADQTIRIWSEKGVLQEIWGEPFAMSQGNVRHEMPKGVREQKEKSHQSDISDVDISQKGKWLLTTGHRSVFFRRPDDGITARIWSRFQSKPICVLQDHFMGLTKGRFSPDYRSFATVSDDATIRVYNIVKQTE